MSDSLQQWFSQHASVAGVQVLGLRQSDQTTATRIEDPSFSIEGVENAWRSVADTFEVLQHRGCAATQLRWVFEHSLLYCLRRPDGACLMAFATPKAREMDPAGLQALFLEFQNLAA
jgi:hypothetical protein